MNTRKIPLIALFIALALSWSGCRKSEKPIVAGPPPTGPVELKLKWPMNRHVDQTLEVKQTVETFVPNMPTPIKQNVSMEQKVALQVLKEEPDGGHEVEMEFIGARISLASGNQSMEVDTINKSSSSTNAMAQALKKITGARLRFFLDASNEVWRIEGMEDLQQRLASGPKDPTGMINSLFSEEYFKQMMSQNKSLPPGPVGPGDSWPVELEYSMGQLGTLLMSYTYTLKEWERRNDHNCARIEFTGTMKTKPGQSLKMAGMTMTIHGGKSSGETWFDLEAGLYVDTAMSQDMTLYMTVPNMTRGNTPGPARPQILTNTVDQVISMKAEPRSDSRLAQILVQSRNSLLHPGKALLPLLLFLAIAAGGCRSAYYAAYEKVGVYKRDLLKKRVIAARDVEKEAGEQFKDALTRLKEMYGFSGGNLEKTYNSLQGEYDDCAGKAEDVHKRIRDVEIVADDLFAEWEKEIKEISTPSLQESSRKQLRLTRERYESLHTALKEAERSMTPVLTQLKDHVLYLKHNLNAQAIASLKGEAASIQTDISRLITQMNAAIARADEFIKTLD